MPSSVTLTCQMTGRGGSGRGRIHTRRHVWSSGGIYSFSVEGVAEGVRRDCRNRPFLRSPLMMAMAPIVSMTVRGKEGPQVLVKTQDT